MYLSKKEQLIQEFDLLERSLQHDYFTIEKGRDLLVRLLTDPQSLLSEEEEQWGKSLHAKLMSTDEDIKRITSLAISLAILAGSEVGCLTAYFLRASESRKSLQLSNYP